MSCCGVVSHELGEVEISLPLTSGWKGNLFERRRVVLLRERTNASIFSLTAAANLAGQPTPLTYLRVGVLPDHVIDYRFSTTTQVHFHRLIF